MTTQPLRIAVVGGGVAGIGAAHVLQRRHQVIVFERNDYLGGHTHTIEIPDGPDAGTPVDTGFIVLNDRTYPLLNRFLAQLQVPVRDSNMSFSFSSEERGFCYNGSNLNGLFAQRCNLFNVPYWRMLFEIFSFNRRALGDLHSGALSGLTLGEYVEGKGYSRAFRDDYLFPMASAIWSTAPDRMLGFPAEYIISFYENHGLLSLSDRPQWKTVVGGSHQYVKAFQREFRGEIRLNAPVRCLRRENGGVTVEVPGEPAQSFDVAILATHANEALGLLGDPTPAEEQTLGAWNYEHNRVVLHTDASVMPPVRRAWASWNYTREKSTEHDDHVSLTYYMNQLQGLGTRRDYFVSLNRRGTIASASVIRELEYTHPVYTLEALRSQAQLKLLNGENSTYYCGGYMGHGFHEDAIRSGVEVAERFGMSL